MSDYSALREEAWAANLEIPRLALAILTWGNASAFDPASGMVAIKPSGVAYADLKPEDMVVLDLEGKTVRGELRPSTDAATHLALYRAWGGIRGVCHTHSCYAVAWAQARRPIPCLGTTHADLTAGPVPCTGMIAEAGLENPPRGPGYEAATGDLILDCLKGRDPREIPAILVAGHGPFAWGKSAMEAVRSAAALEEVARMAAITLGLDPGAGALPDYLVRKHFERKHGKGAYYGQGDRG